jgi:hypothetical protein
MTPNELRAHAGLQLARRRALRRAIGEAPTRPLSQAEGDSLVQALAGRLPIAFARACATLSRPDIDGLARAALAEDPASDPTVQLVAQAVAAALEMVLSG